MPFWFHVWVVCTGIRVKPQRQMFMKNKTDNWNNLFHLPKVVFLDLTLPGIKQKAHAIKKTPKPRVKLVDYNSSYYLTIIVIKDYRNTSSLDIFFSLALLANVLYVADIIWTVGVALCSRKSCFCTHKADHTVLEQRENVWFTQSCNSGSPWQSCKSL